MGLDMYLNAKKYVEKIDWNKIQEDKTDEFPIRDEWKSIVSTAGLDNIASNDVYGAQVEVTAAYWRKSNQIHKWFVDNVQDGEDDCKEYYVSRNKIVELRDLCQEALLKKDPSLLPPLEGFFFGSTDIDNYYWSDIEDTVKQLNKILSIPDSERISFSYQSSW